MENNKKRILVVEDEASLSKALQDKLTHDEFLVLVAKDGEEGLEIALREHPDLILLDLIMPRMGGLEMAKKLREDTWGKNAKIIILTNVSGDMDKVSDSLDNDIFEYLIKSDIKIEGVLAKVKEKLDS